MTTSHIVLDTGTGVIKAGFAGDDYPNCLFSNIIGTTKYPKCMAGALGAFHIGNDVQKHRGMLKLSYPMEHGAVTDWDAMERVWTHVYSSLSVMPEEHNILLTEAPLTTPQMKEKSADIFFETFNVPGICFGLQPVLALYATGNTTGAVLSCGDGVTHAAPIYEGHCLSHAMTRINLAGRDVTKHLQLQLRKAGHYFSTSAEFEILRQMKEQVCYTPHVMPLEEDMARSAQYDTEIYKLPDGSPLSLSVERFRAPNILFNPIAIGLECEPIHEALVNCVRKADTDIRKDLYASIHLAGGTTLLRDFPDRLLFEIRKMVPKDTKIKIRAQQERVYTTWLGGSILASLAAFKSICVSKKQYREEGVRALAAI